MVLALFGLGALTACTDRDGPAENFGEEVDDAVDETGDRLEEAGDEIGDALDN